MAGNWRIGYKGAKAMSEMLKMNTTLTTLYLESEGERKEIRERKRKENDRQFGWR